ncbi:protein FAM207A [Drosophila navojoa]|uniref:protein FAM207A n=1 Tax=Drosophila navojoa TaxID=7232 RepID=UPI000846378A|nr:protein FAM207A [Drosophila navojoa]
MAKRNIRAKAKSAVGAAKQKVQQMQARLNRENRQDKLLHKILSPKKTITKKEKSAEKHSKLIKRFGEIQKKLKEEQARKVREKTKVVGDLKPLRDALPSLGEMYNLVKAQKKKKEEIAVEEAETLSAKKKIKKKRNEYVNKVRSLEKLIKDKNFKKNPREIVANHVRNRYRAMEDEDM